MRSDVPDRNVPPKEYLERFFYINRKQDLCTVATTKRTPILKTYRHHQYVELDGVAYDAPTLIFVLKYGYELLPPDHKVIRENPKKPLTAHNITCKSVVK